MPSLSDLKQSTKIKALIMGDSGAGKTCFATSFPGPIYVADFDNKVESAARFHSPDTISQIDYDKYTEQFTPNPIAALKKKFSELAKDQNDGKLKYKTIILDSLTTFSDEAIKHLIKQNPGIKRQITNVVQLPVLQDYALMRSFMKEFITWILGFDAHVIVTAHIGRERDEITGKILNDPLLTGKLRHELPIWFQEVYRLYVNDKRQHIIQLRPDSNFNCRTQLVGAPNELPASYSALIPYADHKSEMGNEKSTNVNLTLKEPVVAKTQVTTNSNQVTITP